jgi:hypothetical protein
VDIVSYETLVLGAGKRFEQKKETKEKLREVVLGWDEWQISGKSRVSRSGFFGSAIRGNLSFLTSRGLELILFIPLVPIATCDSFGKGDLLDQIILDGLCPGRRPPHRRSSRTSRSRRGSKSDRAVGRGRRL